MFVCVWLFFGMTSDPKDEDPDSDGDGDYAPNDTERFHEALRKEPTDHQKRATAA